MANSEVVKERVDGAPCVTCGATEYDVREVIAVGERQNDDLVGDRYEECRNCGEWYDHGGETA